MQNPGSINVSAPPCNAYHAQLVVIISCLMLVLPVSAGTRAGSMTDADRDKLETLIETGRLNQPNTPEYMRRVAYATVNDPECVGNALEGDFTNLLRRDIRIEIRAIECT